MGTCENEGNENDATGQRVEAIGSPEAKYLQVRQVFHDRGRILCRKDSETQCTLRVNTR